MREQAFGWDNEFDQCSVFVPAFRIQKRSVSNGEYLDFVKDGGPSPHFWATRNGITYWRGMFAEVRLPLDWPVYVTQSQATAYAEWLGASLPSEPQFHRAAYGSASEEREYPWGSVSPDQVPGNFDFRRWDPEPVWSNTGDSGFGVSQLLGNGWQWTCTVFAPFPGFAAHPLYPGYSANFFDGQHYVMKGGSPRTAACMLRRSFRNWFRADYPYTYATFRCVKAD
jgi:formylglycine-generating enzyme required for sulfatase activity